MLKAYLIDKADESTCRSALRTGETGQQDLDNRPNSHGIADCCLYMPMSNKASILKSLKYRQLCKYVAKS